LKWPEKHARRLSGCDKDSGHDGIHGISERETVARGLRDV
jgi:hypothetical protein